MSAAEKNKKKCDPILSLEIFHELHLVLMNILKRKCIFRTLFRVEADRNPLHSPDIIDGALLIEVGERYMPCLLVDLDRRDRRRYLLNDRQLLLPQALDRIIDQIFQSRASETSCTPCPHLFDRPEL